MSAYPGPAAVAAASEILEAAGYHPHKSTIINALRAAESAAMFDRREDEPARPVEDREPVGPYAPTRTPNLDDRAAAAPEQFESGYRQGWRERHAYGTPRYKGLPTLTNRPEGGTELGDYLVEQFGSVGTRIDGLVDVVLGIGRQMTDNRVWVSERFDRIDTALTKLTDLFVDSRDEIERTMTRPEHLRWKEGFDFGIKGFAEEMATARRETREAFERGRQQGDADRAQRGQAEYERGLTEGRMIAGLATECTIDHGAAEDAAFARGVDKGFVRGKTVGSIKREAELLDQGWTPPGDKGERPNRQFTALDMLNQSGWTPRNAVIDIEHELIDQAGPTDYEVWRDALTLSATNVFPIDGTGEAGTFDDDRRAQILADAEFFRHHLINHPTISPAEADQAIDDQIDAITEHEAAADLPAKETPGAEADYPF